MTWATLVARRPLAVWDHSGVCACGRKTYSFGQCSKCLRGESGTALREGTLPEETHPVVDAVVPSSGRVVEFITARMVQAVVSAKESAAA